MNSTPPIPRRRWFRFGLRTMFVVLTVVAMALGWLTFHKQWIADRQRGRQWIEQRNGVIVFAGEPYTVRVEDDLLLHTLDGITWADGRAINFPQAPWQLRILGEPSVYFVLLYEHPSRRPLNMTEVAAKLPDMKRRFPESDIRVFTLQNNPPGKPSNFSARRN